MQPWEQVSCVADIYVAQEGEAFPKVDAVPGGNWVLLGLAGKRDQSVAGVKINFKSTYKFHTTAGAVGWVKAFRTAKEITMECTIEDLTVETFSKKMNLGGLLEVAAASGVAGYKSVGLSAGFDMQSWSVLVRILASPYGDGMNSQFEFPRAVEAGNETLGFDSEGNVVGLLFLFNMLEDPNASSEFERFGRYVAQTAVALP
jgi:hypothetical protein